eukprot:5879-Eustigmatos_ZCMA.PRE.1
MRRRIRRRIVDRAKWAEVLTAVSGRSVCRELYHSHLLVGHMDKPDTLLHNLYFHVGLSGA